jgi:ribosomal protein L3
VGIEVDDLAEQPSGTGELGRGVQGVLERHPERRKPATHLPVARHHASLAAPLADEATASPRIAPV